MKTITKETLLKNEGTILYPIQSTTGKGWDSTESENLSVIESGENGVLFKKILNAIENAQSMICMQSFLIQDTLVIDALITAVEKRQVKVYVLSSAEARLQDKIEEEQDFIKENYIRLLDTKFKNHFIHRSAANFHAKYIIFDPSTSPKGFICTNNFTENGFAKNPELAVELNTEQCQELFKVFVYHFWEYSTDEQVSTNEFEKVKPANKFTLPILENILLTSPNKIYNTLNKELLKAINLAKESISFSTFQLNISTEIIKSIIDKANNKIQVTLFCRLNEKLFNEQLKTLLDAGVNIFFHHLIHAKSLIVDKTEAYIFTSNFTEAGLSEGLEVGIKLNKSQSIDLVKIHSCWQNDFTKGSIKVANILDLTEYEIFIDGNLIKNVLIDDNKDMIRKIIKVSDLISFNNQKLEIRSSNTKSLLMKLSASIEDLPSTIKTKGSEKFEVIEVNDMGEQKSQILAIKNSFEFADMNKISEFSDLKIYYVPDIQN